ncbi:hypothetical protein L873DRAFT_1844993 [Choiromyces venosus 120613-1]|uniref:Uncharacterized protein n=1 Tax=Choiromyces venosus 120613-1 TaxID=1336337 RepID=A0A3N4JLL6_9PEZI|nr:hypothetical protein L873DRAFT_1844993 [Choiromyces venosus 120613-1]
MSRQHEELPPSSEAALRSQLLSPLVIPSSSQGFTLEEVDESSTNTNLDPTSLMRTYVQKKLSVIPTLFKNYDPGVHYVRALVAQDFESQDRPTVMRVFWDAFHGLGSDGKSPFPDVWMDWREQRQEALWRTISRQSPDLSEAAGRIDQTFPARESSRKSPFDLPSSDFAMNGAVKEYSGETKGIRASSSRQSMRAKLVDIRPRNPKSQLNLTAITLETAAANCPRTPPLGTNRHRSILQRNSISGEFAEKSSNSASYLPSSEPLSVTWAGKDMDPEESETSPSMGRTSSDLPNPPGKPFDWIRVSDGPANSYSWAKDPEYPNPTLTSKFQDESTKTPSYQSNISGVSSNSGDSTTVDFELRVKNVKKSNPRLEAHSKHLANLLLPIQVIGKGQGRTVVSRPAQSLVASPATNSLMSVLESKDIQGAGIKVHPLDTEDLPTSIYSPHTPQVLSLKSDGTISLGEYEDGPFVGMANELVTESKRTYNTEGAFHREIGGCKVLQSSQSRVQDHPSILKRTTKDIGHSNLKAPTKMLSRFSLSGLPRSLSVVDKMISPSEGSGKVLHLSPTPEESEVEDISIIPTAKPLVAPRAQTSKAPSRWAKSSLTKAIGGMIQEGVERTMPHLGRKPVAKEIPKGLPQPMTPPLKVNKSNISAPFASDNPLQLSSSASTPNIIHSAIPIGHVPRSNSIPLQKLMDITNSQRDGSGGKPTELLPWELQHSDNSDGGSLSDQFPAGSSEKHVTQTYPSAKDKSLPAVTISPMDQASLYAWAECTVIQACSDFLRAQQLSIDIALLGKEVKKWEDEKIRLSTGETKNRDKVIEFMFGMEIQCRLIEGNMKLLHFSGPGALNPANIIAAWKAIIPSLTPRTFCIPDYLVLEHFRVFEKVLGLFGPVYYDAEKFENRRAGLVRRIIRSGEAERRLLRVKRLATLREEREKAEEDLLKEVGLLTIGEED